MRLTAFFSAMYMGISLNKGVMDVTDLRNRFRKVLGGNECVFPASVFDPISARIAESIGFQTGMLAGSVASAVVLGVPDIVLLTLTELVEQVRRITRASKLSLMVDADHGYGNAMNVRRTVEELEDVGVSALTIEDTVLPTPFRRRLGEEMISVEEMVDKLGAALAARRDPSTVIIGRTSALKYSGIDEAVYRVRAYTEVGIDAIFLTGITSRDQVYLIEKDVRLPLILGNIPDDLKDPEMLAYMGVRIALTGHLPFRAAIKAVYEGLSHLKSGGVLSQLDDKVASEELMDLVTDRHKYFDLQKEYLE